MVAASTPDHQTVTRGFNDAKQRALFAVPSLIRWYAGESGLRTSFALINRDSCFPFTRGERE